MNNFLDRRFSFPFPLCTGFVFLIALLTSCGGGYKEEVPLDQVHIELDLARPDLAMWKAAHAYTPDSTLDLQVFETHLKPHRKFFLQYLYFDDDSLATDSLMSADLASFLRNEMVLDLLDTVNSRFPESYPMVENFTNPMKRFNYYFPEKPLPQIRTFVSGFTTSAAAGTDEALFNPPLLALGLHYYMGQDFYFYPPDLPAYARRQFSEPFLVRNAFRAISMRLLPDLPPISQPKLLDRMINRGKRLYFLDKVIPQTADSIKINYSADQMYWAEYFEARIWNELLPHLYSADHKVQGEYLDEAPFTSKLSRESAPRIGEFAGWMIVRAYMKKNPDTELAELMAMPDADLILKGAAYRPRSKE
ncbi:MAG: hypothetical protein H6581_31230 [Bacteroidia bacterium]|nr:hypothetical protein [Bacteroidia bacterium]